MRSTKIEIPMKIERRWVLATAVLLLPLLVIPTVKSDEDNTRLNWTIFGQFPAVANDGSIIRVGGTGSFSVDDPDSVTTGETSWATFSPSGAPTGNGTFQVTGLVKFDLAPGKAANPNFRAGLAFLRITYSDGSKGILDQSNSGLEPPGLPILPRLLAVRRC